MKRLIVIIATAMLLTLPIATAHASSPQPVDGTFAVEGLTPTSFREAGNNCIIKLNAVFSFTGDLSGSFTADFRLVHRGPCELDQPAPDNFVAQGTYTGTVLDSAGAFDFLFRGGVDDQGIAQGRLVVLQGDGGLGNLHGTIDLSGQAGVGGTYSGRVHFDP